MLSVTVSAGVYVIAVSGGVDSMVLLDLLRHHRDVRLIVAHFDHGIRVDSAQDRVFVQNYAMSHNLQFEYAEGNLGKEVSEHTARNARYGFLRRIRSKYSAQAVLTAHHQDDLIETAIINVARGTGWRGLASLRSTPDIGRPLLPYPKSALTDYAIRHNISWREDPTNAGDAYMRNRVRHAIVPQLSNEQRARLIELVDRQTQLAEMIDQESSAWREAYAKATDSGVSIVRYRLVMLPTAVAEECLQSVIRSLTGASVERPLLERAHLFAKVAKAGKVFQLGKVWQLRINQGRVIVEPRPLVVS